MEDVLNAFRKIVVSAILLLPPAIYVMINLSFLKELASTLVLLNTI